MAKVNVGSRTYAWGEDVVGLKLDPKAEGNIVLTTESAPQVLEAIGRSGFKSSLGPLDFDEVFLVDGTGGMRKVVVGRDNRQRAEDRNRNVPEQDEFYPLTVWRTTGTGTEPAARTSGETAPARYPNETDEQYAARTHRVAEEVERQKERDRQARAKKDEDRANEARRK